MGEKLKFTDDEKEKEMPARSYDEPMPPDFWEMLESMPPVDGKEPTIGLVEGELLDKPQSKLHEQESRLTFADEVTKTDVLGKKLEANDGKGTKEHGGANDASPDENSPDDGPARMDTDGSGVGAKTPGDRLRFEDETKASKLEHVAGKTKGRKKARHKQARRGKKAKELDGRGKAAGEKLKFTDDEKETQTPAPSHDDSSAGLDDWEEALAGLLTDNADDDSPNDLVDGELSDKPKSKLHDHDSKLNHADEEAKGEVIREHKKKGKQKPNEHGRKSKKQPKQQGKAGDAPDAESAVKEPAESDMDASDNAASSPKRPRSPKCPTNKLTFDDKKISKLEQKAEKQQRKAEKARSKQPKRKKIAKERLYDEKKGKAKTKLIFEEEAVPIKEAKWNKPKKQSIPLKIAKGTIALSANKLHGKVHEVEHENVGTQASHHAELVGESAYRGGKRLIHSAYRHVRNTPYRKAAKFEAREIKTRIKLDCHKALKENPKIKSNAMSRFMQKQKIKRQYAAELRKAKKSGQAIKKTGGVVSKATQFVNNVIRRNPVSLLKMGLLLLLILIPLSLLNVCTSLLSIGTSFVGAVSYAAEDADIDNAELAYTEWETDLQIEIANVESAYAGYDEYRYNVSEIGHDPFELMAFLTAVYGDFTFAEIEPVLRDLFAQQYRLTYTESTETRTQTRTIEVGQSLGMVRTTAYCACRICCGVWAGGPTASGVMPRSNHTIAVDARNPIVPMGTRVVINGVIYTAEDTGNLVASGTDFDIFFDSHSVALAWGRQTHEAFLFDGNGNSVVVTSTEESRILTVTLAARSLSTLIQSRMTNEQRQHFELLMVTKGARQYVANPFEINWLPFVTSSYGYRIHPITNVKDHHQGIDIARPAGTGIRAGLDGTVVQVGHDGGYGNYVVIGDGKGLEAKYAHCNSVSVASGQVIRKGDMIATVGSTGSSTGPHLHMEVVKNGQYLNPIYFVETGDDGSGRIPPGMPGGA